MGHFFKKKLAIRYSKKPCLGYCAFERQPKAASSVTRLGDLLDFGQLFKAFGNNKFAQISHILR